MRRSTLTGGESQDLPSGLWQMNNNLGVSRVFMAEFYHSIGLTANGSVPESMAENMSKSLEKGNC